MTARILSVIGSCLEYGGVAAKSLQRTVNGALSSREASDSLQRFPGCYKAEPANHPIWGCDRPGPASGRAVSGAARRPRRSRRDEAHLARPGGTELRCRTDRV